MSLNLSIKGFGRNIKLLVEKEVKEPVVGINSNLCNSNGDRWFEHHFLMIDYDDMLSLRNLITEIQRLQVKWNLPNAHIFESSYHHYIVYFFGVDRDYFECLKVIHDTPCCRNYKKLRMETEAMTLRISTKGHKQKPKFVCMVKNPEVDFFDSETDNEYIMEEQDKIRRFILGDEPITWEGKKQWG